MNLKSVFAALAVGVACSQALAAGAGPYVGIGAGTTRFDADCSGTSACDNSDTGYKIVGGYKFDETMAAELTYFNLGKATATYLGVDAEIKTTAIGLGMAFRGNFGSAWSGVARLGLASVSTDIDVRYGPHAGSDSERTAKVYAGLGLAYAVTSALKIEAAWDFTQTEYEDQKGRVDLLSIGLVYDF